MCRTHATVRSLLGALVDAAPGVTVTDMEAGLEHLGRGTARHADALIAVVEPYFKSLETGRKVAEFSQELGVARVYALANKVQSSEDEEAIHEFCARAGLRVIGTVPYDSTFVAADRQGRGALDVAPWSPGVQEIARLAAVLEDGAVA